jgi:uncharacterized damage-inducible protein DinB
MLLDTIRSLYGHQAWADAAILTAAAKHEAAAQDETLRKTLHHIVVVQRAFLALFVKRPFDFTREMQTPESLPEVEKLFRAIHAEQIEFASQLQEAQLSAPFDMPYLPGSRLTTGEALIQVIMHSQHHRGQCAARLRVLGVDPPLVDFIIWLKDRPAAWS